MRAQNYGDDKLVSVFLTQITNKKGQPKRFEEKLLWGKPVFREILKLTDGGFDDFGEMTLAGAADEAGEIECVFSMMGGVDAFTGADAFDGFLCGEGLFDEKNIVAVLLWICAELW
jgi:hypothetical protein